MTGRRRTASGSHHPRRDLDVIEILRTALGPSKPEPRPAEAAVPPAVVADYDRRLAQLEERLAAYVRAEAAAAAPPPPIGAAPEGGDPADCVLSRRWRRNAATAVLAVVLLLASVSVCGGEIRGILVASDPVVNGCYLTVGEIRESLFEIARWIPLAHRAVPIAVAAQGVASPLAGAAALLLSAWT